MDYMPKREPSQKYPGELLPGTRTLECPLTVMADSYKAGHHLMYPDALEMSAYGEFRAPFKVLNKGGGSGDSDLIKDSRIVFYGLRYYIQQFLARGITEDDIKRSEKFYAEHNMGGTPVSYPKKLFDRIEELGYFPVKIQALPEGTVVYPHTPVFIITAEKEFSHLCTFLETMLTMVWYPSCVATLSRHTKSKIKEYYTKSAHPDDQWLLDSALHDFGFRGCTCIEQSVLGGSAHLLNFTGSDTMSAAYHVQFHMNKGVPVAHSPAATEHSVMTSWPSEIEAMKNLIKKFAGQVISCVMDSFDYDNALEKLLPEIMDDLIESNSTFVIRPDSGDPVRQVTFALEMAEKAVSKTGKKFALFKDRKAGPEKGKKFEKVFVIQGDGIDFGTVDSILQAVDAKGFSPANVVFGMGGGLLQKVNRDSMMFATKLSYIKYKDGTERNIMKAPKTDSGKWSLPGKLAVCRRNNEMPLVYEKAKADAQLTTGEIKDEMITVYDYGKVNTEYMTETFETIRQRVETQWANSDKVSSHVGKSAVEYSLAFKQVLVAAGIHKWVDNDLVTKIKEVMAPYSLIPAQKKILNDRFVEFFSANLFDGAGNYLSNVKINPSVSLQSHADFGFQAACQFDSRSNQAHSTLQHLDRLLDSAVSRF
jgi:nicotinamide phosphoribosyltransferase